MSAEMEGQPEQEQEAQRLKTLADIKFNNANLKSALKYAKRAQRLHPNLDGISEMVTSFKILRLASKFPEDWYKILQIEPFSHINTIKKQYKKLALILHPDKNPYSGSEEAFKLVGEAFRFLSDKIRRKEYDMKLRIRIQEEKIGGGGLEVEEEKDTFWTACSTCRLLHQFEKMYVGHELVCPNCRKSFKALEVETNESKAEGNGDKVGSEKNLRNVVLKKNSSSFERAGDLQSKQKVSGNERMERMELRGKSSRTSVKLNSKIGSKKKNGGLNSKVNAGGVEAISGDGEWSCGRLRKRMSSVGEVLERCKPKKMENEEETMTLAEMHSAAKRQKLQEKLKMKSKEKLEKEKVKEDEEEEKQIHSTKRKDLEINRQGVSKKNRVSEIVEDVTSKKSVRFEKERHRGSDGDDLDIMVVEDSDFYDFDKDRVERSFKKGQVWAIYDDDDGMPRHYGLIEEVVSVNPFELKMSWLDLQSNGDEGLICWEKMGFHVSCGRFKVARKTSIESLNIFSHVADCERAAREIYRIYPKKGSVWALYNEAAMGAGGQTVSTTDKRRYAIVVFLTTYSEMHGMSMAYLEKVNGYKTIFRRREIGCHAIRWFEKDDVRMFSHQIPARKLNGDEIPELKDCWELDPASLPSDLLAISQCK